MALKFLADIIAVIFAVSIHEFSHAWMADRLGDPTGRISGRLTLNPLRHFDFFGTLSLIFFGIGWGKPVPFNPENLRHPKRDGALIGAAGPFSNLITAVILAAPLKYLDAQTLGSYSLAYMLMSSVFMISIILFALNVLPFPPFDGSKIIGAFVPHRYHFVYEQYLREGMKYVILFILFDVLVIEKVAGVSLLQLIVGKITMWIMAIISLGT